MSSRPHPDFDWLVQPIGRRRFVDDYWQQRPVRLPNRGRVPDEVFSSLALEELIEVAQPKPPSIRLAAVGKPERPVSDLRSGRVDVGNIRHAFLDGYTIIVNNVQRFHPPLHRFVETLQCDASHPIEANCYFTPPGAQGFAPHYDSHDVLVLQVEGHKRWSLYGEDAARPLHQLVDGDPFDRGTLDPPESFDMSAGDVLYIPRGWVHEAETAADASSLHVTFGVHVQTGRDLMRSAIDAMSRIDPEFLAALPFGFHGDGQPDGAVADTLAELTRRLAERQPSEIADAYLHDQLIQRTEPTGPVGLVDLAERLDFINDTTLVRLNPTVPYRVVDCGETVMVQFTSRLVNLPQRFASTVANLPGVFRVGELTDLDGADRISLVRQLIRDDLLQFDDVAVGRALAG